ncbi:hypothetical protein HYALB_00009972 [Hymenoscyphus albidus]|uniref:Transcription elongation factor SPT5 n=1 Tax=Hymenoscyphus albidus TaxID=595503 RepID=A0A9N9LRZ1_9HELO|nr:hypothetical protein HYALB_00009972 [Hymenoscyphus albidus]
MSTSNLLNRNLDDSDEEDDNFNPQPADLSDAEGGDDDEDAGAQIQNEASKGRVNHDDDSEDEDGDNGRARPAQNDDEDDEEGGDDDDEEDEEEDEDEEEISGPKRKRVKRSNRNVFLDVEAEVDEDEDEDENEDDENEIRDNFIADTHPDDEADLPAGGEMDDRRHRELDRQRELEASMDAEQQAEALRLRYSNKRGSGKGLGDSDIVPRRLLLPSINDPSIWAVRCKEGKEKEAIFSIMKRIEEKMGTKDELAITSAFERGGTQSTMKGYIYVEAQRASDILTALDGLMNIYPRTKMEMIEIKEMPDLLRVTKTAALEPGAYVRLKRPPKYSGDLAQIIDVTDTGLELRVRYVPRLDYGMHEDVGAGPDGGKRKRVTAGPRPPQRLFSEVDAKKRHAKYLQGNPQSKTWSYLGDDYINGFCEKDVKLQAIDTKDVNPTLEEVTRFASGQDDGTENLDLNALAASLKSSTVNTSYQPGDIIEVYDGEQKGVLGKAISIRSDIVTMAVLEGPLRGKTIEVPVKGLRKRFREGDHVKVIGGSRYRDEVGMVVKIVEDRVTLLSDHGNAEITVFSKDLREASDSGGSGSLGKYELWDLVQLDAATVACIVKVDRESMVVLDQNNQTRTVMPSQISNKIEKQRGGGIATDRSGNEIKLEENVKEYGGEGRTGKIIHIHRTYLYLKSSSQSKNAGIFVTRTNAVNSMAAKGVTAVNAGPDLTSMNPAMKRNPGAAPGGDMPPPKSFGRDRSIGQTVTIRKGPYKGLLGIVKETSDNNARVELHTKNKTVNVPKDALAFKDKLTGATIDVNSRGGRGGFTPRGGGRGATPHVGSGWEGGRTPAAGGDVGRTPAWGRGTPAMANGGGRTPAWKAPDNNGGRTPAWADGSRTANPYDGSRTSYGGGNRTPAWSSGAKTPYGQSGFDAGSKTPGYSGGGGDSWGSKTPAYNQPTPAAESWEANQPSGGQGWGGSNPYDAPTPGNPMSAPTPAALNAPTPGAYSAPTPAPYNAPTPGAAPTPAPGWGGAWGAPTPQAMDAPTPGGQQGYYGAPTPGAYGVPETPAANWQDDGPRYVD